MFENGRLTVRSTLAAGLAGLAVLAGGLAAAAPALARAGTAGAPAAAPAAAGSFKTWAAAEKAAGFTLHAPARTFGLVRRQDILVTRCAAASGTRYDVYARWGGATYLALDQNDTGAACSNPGPSKYLHTYRSGGVTYRLRGFCGGAHQPSCRSKKAILYLVWTIGTRYYAGYSSGVTRSTLLGFATSLKRV